jgi:hypothetical protein
MFVGYALSNNAEELPQSGWDERRKFGVRGRVRFFHKIGWFLSPRVYGWKSAIGRLVMQEYVGSQNTIFEFVEKRTEKPVRLNRRFEVTEGVFS